MDDADIVFFSDWDVDQILQQGTVNVTTTGSGSQTIVDFSALDLDYTPMFMIVTRVDGTARWSMQNAGPSSIYTAQLPVRPVIKGTTLFVEGGGTGVTYNVRYYLYKRSLE